jgi:predicted flap endonuclease-1-like 5' DNA nuclease
MSGSIAQLGLFLVIAVVVGAVIGWVVRGLSSSRQHNKANDEWQLKFSEATRQRDKFNAENHKFRTAIEAQQASLHQHETAANRSRVENESMREKLKSVAKERFSLQAERDQLAKELANLKNAMDQAKRQVAELAAEFRKSGDFYKGELAKAFESRKLVEAKLDGAKAEQDSLSNLLNAAKAESASVNKMLAAAQARLENLDELERKSIALEAENAQLRHDASMQQQEMASLQRDVAELEELKLQNRELAHCLKSMENSRSQYEVDAKRYRDQAQDSEKLSETLRVKLDDVEKNIANMAKQNDEARKQVHKQRARKKTNGASSTPPVSDDLTQIVGIGKVFQHTLNKLGIYTFEQIAKFGPDDIARVNLALEENRGRMEQDDWIGQAKELYYKKHSERVEH